ncbi:hypothetical protein [Actinoplanes flavus]|uniref:Uncharacterized protein n=1 Tax=Actinoplanes flavus TaxID=2820290 RepID=A0ABS3USY7_9ACTN|nr:hypothetical protein [Actinoplanes flavus]MBO3741690.1 hypothetical protein [Actinoplanes flavus]
MAIDPRNPLFWPAYLLEVGLAHTAAQAFDVDPDAYCDHFEDPDHWPTFTIPLAAGTLHLTVRNLPDDHGIDWHLDEPATRSLTTHLSYAHRGLPWHALSTDPAHLLMALPTCGEPTLTTRQRTAVTRALRAVGATTHVTELTDDLIQHRPARIL